jgi:hypothetical protein
MTANPQAGTKISNTQTKGQLFRTDAVYHKIPGG